MKNHDDKPAAGAVDDGPESQPLRGMARLRDVEPPPSLVAGVMRRIGEPRPFSLWRWLRRPVIQVRLSPLSAGAGALGLAVVAVLALRSAPARRAAPAPAEVATAPASAPAAVPVRVRFRLQAKGARRVALAGSFNQWSPDRIVLEPVSPGDGDAGIFAGTVDLPPGTYEYMFIVDGKWVTDPAAEERRDDGFGRQNALLRL
jgi:hypothetical protein